MNKLQGNTDEHPVAFAFLSHQSFQEHLTLKILHSFMFQLMIDNKALRPVLIYNYENNYRKLTSSPAFVSDLLKDILVDSLTTYFVVDGLDEVADTERSMLLVSLMDLQRQSSKLKLLISSRAEYDISLHLKSQCEMFLVHQRNFQDIADYVETRTDVWLSGMNLSSELICEIRRLTEEIAPKSKGVLSILQLRQLLATY